MAGPASGLAIFRGKAIWLVFAVTLAVLPMLFRSSLAISMLSQIGYTIIIFLSYNILLGQGGMLSFGHTVYTGLGAFIALHAMNLATRSGVALPLVVVPLIGGLGGLVFAILFGYVTTKKSGTTFAMITLGIGELVAAMSLMLPGFFGGEGGITTNRVYGSPFLGLTFGPQIQVYYLISGYCIAATALMFAFTGTPLGRLLNAVRDNPERVEFIGYNTQWVRYLGFVIAGFFAGIGGALSAINFEIVSAADSLSTLRAGGILLFTFLGGATFFFGPIVGAVLLVFAFNVLSELTKAWLLYLGLVFLLMVMYAPGGIASLIMMNLRVAKFGKLHRLAAEYAGLALTGALAFLGLSALIEMVYHKQLNEGLDPTLHFMGIGLNVEAASSWLGVAVVAAIGVALFEWARKAFARRWGEVQGEIEASLRARESV